MRAKKYFLTIVLFISTLAGGCRPTTSSIQTEQPVPAFVAEPAATTISPTQTPAPTAQPTALDNPERGCSAPYFPSKAARPQYRLDVYASLEQHTFNIHQNLIYQNTSEDWLGNIKMVVEPNWTNDVFSLTEIKINDAPLNNHLLSGGYLEIPLDTPLPPSCAIEINLKYMLKLPNQAGVFGYTYDQTMLTNWYPFIPPYHPDWHWQTNNPASYGEHLVYPLADFEVQIEFQDKEPTIPIAAPTQAKATGSKVTYRLNQARTFSLAILPRHKQLSTTINGTTYTVYYQIAAEDTAQAALNTMAESIAAYEKYFGPYPFTSLTTAEINMADGMEYDGIFFLGRGIFSTYDLSAQNIFTLLLAHETAHNWWFSQAGSDQAIEPWLDEALATYCELLYLETHYPELVDWWWDFRVKAFEPYGPVNVTIYDFYDYEPYRQAVYLRGVLFIQAVRDEIGDEAFFEFLSQYYSAGKGNIATGNLFFEILEQAAPNDISPVRWQYFGDW